MEIVHRLSANGGVFYYLEKGEEIAEISYRNLDGNKIVLDHTWAKVDARGKGIGKILFDKVVEFARSEHLKIVPLCAFVKYIVERNKKEYADIL